jgi:hypothetical protein
MIRTKLTALFLASLAIAALPGCGGGPAKISGKVIPGNVSFVGLADTSDERLKGDGIAGAKVGVYSEPEKGGTLVGQTTSDSRGNFTVSVDAGSILRPAEFRAERDGYVTASTVMSIPPSNRQVLMILKAGGGGAGK